MKRVQYEMISEEVARKRCSLLAYFEIQSTHYERCAIRGEQVAMKRYSLLAYYEIGSWNLCILLCELEYLVICHGQKSPRRCFQVIRRRLAILLGNRTCWSKDKPKDKRT